MQAIYLPFEIEAKYLFMQIIQLASLFYFYPLPIYFYFVEQSHFLLRSTPYKFVLQFPAWTPSGFTIGMALIQQFFLKYYASLSFERRQSIIPSIMKDPGVYPGCCLANKIIKGLDESLDLNFGFDSLMTSESILLPPRVFGITFVFWQKCLL